MQQEAGGQLGDISWADDAITIAIIDMMANLDMIDLKHEGGQRLQRISMDFKSVVMETVKKIDEPKSQSVEDIDHYLATIIIQAILEQISKATGGSWVTHGLLMEMLQIVYKMLDFSELAGLLHQD